MTFKRHTTLVQALLIVSLNFFCITQNLFAQTFVEQHGRLQVQGNRIVDKNNNEISLAGNSLFWSIAGDVSDFYNSDTVEHIATNWNSSIIRAAMGVQETWDAGRGYIDDPEYQIDKIRRVVDAAIEQGIYVIIDWHSHEAERYTQEAADFFKQMASLYGDTPNVIYEIYNEPINQSWPTIKTYAETVINAIRAEDADNLIIVGTGFYSQEVDEASEDPITDNNVAYTLHFYAATHKQNLRNRAITALNNGVALFVTEWGAVEASGDGDIDFDETQRWMDFLKENGISHASWSLSDKPSNNNRNVLEGSAVVALNGGFDALQNNRLSEYGFFVQDIIQNWTDFKSSNENQGPVSSKTIINFDTKTTELTPFNGLDVSIVNNPQLNGSNPEASNVVRVSNSAEQDFEGFATGVIELVDFGPNSTKTILVDVYATSAVSVDLQVKAVNVMGNVIASPRGASKVVGHGGTGWEQMEFDFTSRASKSFDGFDDDGEANFVPEGLFSQIVMLIDPGAPAPNGANTYFIDNIRVTTGEENSDDNQEDEQENMDTSNPSIQFENLNETLTVDEGYNLTLNVLYNANGSNVALSNIQLFIDNTLVRQENSAPYEWGHANSPNPEEVNGLSAGNYTIKAVATARNGSTFENEFTLVVNRINADSSNPSIQFENLNETLTVDEGYNLTLNVLYNADGSNVALSNIQLFIDNTLIRQENSAPYEWGHANSPNPEEVNGLSAGNYTIKAVATARNGNTFENEFTLVVNRINTDNSNPSIQFENLNETLTVNEGYNLTLNVLYNANGSNVALSNIQLFIDNTLVRQENSAPYEWGHANSPNPEEVNGLSAGNYTIKAVATARNGSTFENEITLVVNRLDTNSNTCAFGTPLTSALPTFSSASFSNIYVLGNGGPDVSKIRRFRINWDQSNNGLYQFAVNTTDGVPSYYVDFMDNMTFNFNSIRPDMTLTNSGLSNWDGSYWVSKDDENFVMVSKTGGYTIYFTNGAIPNCSNSSAKLVNKNTDVKAVQLYPNPATNRINISGNLSTSTVVIIDMQGRTVMRKNYNTQNAQINISNLSKGAYILKINGFQTQKTFSLIKQ